MKKVQSPLGGHKRAQTAHKGSGCQQQHCRNSGHRHENLCKAHNPKVRVDVKLHEKKQSPYIHMHIQCKQVWASMALVKSTCNSFRVRFTHISASAPQKRKGNQNWKSDIVHRSEK